MTQYIRSGNYELGLSPAVNEPVSSLVVALLDQRARRMGAAIKLESHLVQALTKLILETLQESGHYHTEVPQIVHQTEVYRALVTYLQCTIELRYPDGLIRLYPYQYQCEESVYRIYCDNLRYYSISQVRSLRYSNDGSPNYHGF